MQNSSLNQIFMNKKYLPLFLIIIVFIAVKIPQLTFPHYWDESWSYATAVQIMYEKGITLLPGHIDVNATRGHPLFFYAAAASWMRIFGSSLISKHTFALFLSVLLLITVYHVCLQFGNIRRAVITTLLFAAQIFFVVQSSMLLPEVMVTLLFFLSIYFYTTERYVMLALTLSLLFLTKESGLVVGLVLGLLFIASWISGALSLRKGIQLFSALMIPLLIIITFFTIQKMYYGWFLFPEHISLINNNSDQFLEKIHATLFIIFIQDERQWLWLLMGVLAVFYAIRERQSEWFLYVAGIGLIFAFQYLPFDFLQSLFAAISFILYLLFICIRWQIRAQSKTKQGKFLFTAMLSCIVYAIFCSINFYTSRYLLPILLFSFILISTGLDIAINKFSTLKLHWPITVTLIIVTILSYFRNDNFGDTGLGSYQALKVEQDIIQFFPKNNLSPATPISLNSFQQTTNMKNSACGFIPNDNAAFTDLQWGIDRHTRYIIFDNIEPDYRYDEVTPDTNFTLVYQTVHGKMWGKIYEKKRPIYNQENNSGK